MSVPRSRSSSFRRALAVLASATLSAVVIAAPVAAAGDSTPGVNIKAMNPAVSRLGSDLELSLTAHSELSTVTDPSCRPQDATIECWGSLMMRIPSFGDLAVGDFDVHRVAVGDISCGDEGGHDDCGDHDAGISTESAEPLRAQVNGVAFVKWPGNTGLAVGTKLQVKLTFTDNGSAPYVDVVVVQVNLFVEGPTKPLLYLSQPETIRQVQIRVVDER